MTGVHTVHELAADWSWMETHGGFYVHGSRMVWEQAEYGRYGGLAISRIVETHDGHLRVIKRWIAPEKPIRFCTTVSRRAVYGEETDA